jgi:hypothetical protein
LVTVSFLVGSGLNVAFAERSALSLQTSFVPLAVQYVGEYQDHPAKTE